MDNELKEYLEAMEKRLNDRIAGMAQHVLIEMGTRFKETNSTLASIDSRLNLQAGLIQAGSRAMARFSEFAESSEQRWVALVHRVEALEKRFGDS